MNTAPSGGIIRSQGIASVATGVPPRARAIIRLLLSLTLLLGAAGCEDDGTGPEGAWELAFVVPPTSISVGTPLSPPVAVAIRDRNGNTIPGWTEGVHLTLEGGGGATLTGTTTLEPLAGLAIFPDLEISGSGTGLRIRASSATLDAVVSPPFDVYGVFQAARLTAGEHHTCALKEDGTAYCFGFNGGGRLGTGDILSRTLPTPVQTELKFASISALGLHTCGLSLDAEVYCWGDNRRGQLGDGTLENRPLPQKVLLPGPAASVDAGFWHTCALLEDGDAYCWGDNWGGALGTGVVDTLRVSPVRVVGDHQWVQMEAGYLQSCGLTSEGEAYCWGPNVYGANGDGTRGEPRPSPTPVAGGHTFVHLVAGGGPCHGETCGITTVGTVLCWGRNYQRHLVSSEVHWTEPTAIQGDPGWVDVFIGPNMVCGHDPQGELSCIGDAQYGIMETTAVPQALVPELEVASVVQGQTHACVLTLEGNAHCWGSNAHGQLGSDSQATGWTSPVPVWDPPGG